MYAPFPSLSVSHGFHYHHHYQSWSAMGVIAYVKATAQNGFVQIYYVSLILPSPASNVLVRVMKVAVMSARVAVKAGESAPAAAALGALYSKLDSLTGVKSL